MKFVRLLPLAAIAAAFVVPEERVLSELSLERTSKSKNPSRTSSFGRFKDDVDDAVNGVEHVLDQALEAVMQSKKVISEELLHSAQYVNSWLEASGHPLDLPGEFEEFGEHPPPPHGPPPPHPPPPDHRPPKHPPPGHKPPHHPPHHRKPNETIYQLISKSKYTTKLAKLISEDEALVKILNGTAANYTLFAPTDKAFEKIPHHGEKPSKEFIKAVLLYHISPHCCPARCLLFSHTIPTLLKVDTLGEEPLPQRLSVKGGFRLTLNFYSRVVAANIFATNGVIHGVDSIIIPPPKVLTILELLPSEFSTLTLGLTKTGLWDTLKSTAHAGGTFFAPSNFAFKKLGPKINAFLFSKYGEKYLKALLQYHVVLNQTLYSDAFYKSDSVDETSRPHNNFHVDLPTLLDDRALAIDVTRRGPFIFMRINGFSRVAVQDGIAKDGVIQVVGEVLIPPKTKRAGSGEPALWQGEEMTEEELMERLEPYVSEDDERLEL